MLPEIPRWMWQLAGCGFLLWAAYTGTIEGIAIFNRHAGDTATEIIRSWHLPTVVWFLLAGLATGGVLWMGMHFSKLGELLGI